MRNLMAHFRTPADSPGFGYSRPPADDARFRLAQEPEVERYLPFPLRLDREGRDVSRTPGLWSEDDVRKAK